MTLVLVPAGRGNWKTQVVMHLTGPQAPGPMQYRLGQRIPLPVNGVPVTFRVVGVFD